MKQHAALSRHEFYFLKHVFSFVARITTQTTSQATTMNATLVIGYQWRAATHQIKQTNMADGEDEPEFKVDQKPESQKFALYRDLEGYRSLWDTSFIPSNNKQQNKQQKDKKLGETASNIELMAGLSPENPSLHENFLISFERPLLVFTEQRPKQRHG